MDRIFSANFWGNKNIPQIFETTGRKKAPEESNLAVAYISNTTKTYKFKQQSGNLHLGRGDVETKMPPYSGISDHKLVNIRQERLAMPFLFQIKILIPQKNPQNLSSCWFQPLWEICSSKWEPSPNRGENKKYLKPPSNCPPCSRSVPKSSFVPPDRTDPSYGLNDDHSSHHSTSRNSHLIPTRAKVSSYFLDPVECRKYG